VRRLFHIALQADWERARLGGLYCESTLGRRVEDVGFIHLSFAEQVKLVADAAYRGRTDLVLLELDPGQLRGRVRVEAVADSDQRFPHLYGEIAIGEVVAVHELVPCSDGSFEPIL
jgi:glutathione S-transferase